MYLDAKDITAPDLSDNAYTLGILKIHHVKWLNLHVQHVLSFVNALHKVKTIKT